jgi:hypothetical protein
MKRGAALLACFLSMVIGCGTENDQGANINKPHIEEVGWFGEATLIVNSQENPDIVAIGTEAFRIKTVGDALLSMERNGRQIRPFAFAFDGSTVTFATKDDLSLTVYAGVVHCKSMSGRLVDSNGWATGMWELKRED